MSKNKKRMGTSSVCKVCFCFEEDDSEFFALYLLDEIFSKNKHKQEDYFGFSSLSFAVVLEELFDCLARYNHKLEKKFNSLQVMDKFEDMNPVSIIQELIDWCFQLHSKNLGGLFLNSRMTAGGQTLGYEEILYDGVSVTC